MCPSLRASGQLEACARNQASFNHSPKHLITLTDNQEEITLELFFKCVTLNINLSSSPQQHSEEIKHCGEHIEKEICGNAHVLPMKGNPSKFSASGSLCDIKNG